MDLTSSKMVRKTRAGVLELQYLRQASQEAKIPAKSRAGVCSELPFCSALSAAHKTEPALRLLAVGVKVKAQMASSAGED